MIILVDQLLPELHSPTICIDKKGLEPLAVRDVDVRDDNVRGTARGLVGIFDFTHFWSAFTVQLGMAFGVKYGSRDLGIFTMCHGNIRIVLTGSEAGQQMSEVVLHVLPLRFLPE